MEPGLIERDTLKSDEPAAKDEFVCSGLVCVGFRGNVAVHRGAESVVGGAEKGGGGRWNTRYGTGRTGPLGRQDLFGNSDEFYRGYESHEPW